MHLLWGKHYHGNILSWAFSMTRSWVQFLCLFKKALWCSSKSFIHHFQLKSLQSTFPLLKLENITHKQSYLQFVCCHRRGQKGFDSIGLNSYSLVTGLLVIYLQPKAVEFSLFFCCWKAVKVHRVRVPDLSVHGSFWEERGWGWNKQKNVCSKNNIVKKIWIICCIIAFVSQWRANKSTIWSTC